MSDEKLPQDSLEKPAESKDVADGEGASTLEPEILNKLPPEVRRAVEFTMQSFSAPIFHPVTKKINEAHIDKILDQAEEDSKREYKDRNSGRIFGLVYAFLGAALFVFATIYLVGQDKDLYRDLLTKIIIFFGGGGLGYGVKAYFDRE